MRRVALRGVLAHPGRFLLSLLAVLLGVAFVAGTFSLRAMLSATFADIVETSTTGDAYLRGADQATTTFSTTGAGGGRNDIPMALADVAADVDGVARVRPEVSGPIIVVGADGTAVVAGTGAPSFAIGLHPDEPTVSVLQGRAPHGPDEIAMESGALEASGLAVGDRTTVLAGPDPTEVEVVGEVAFGAPAAGALVFFVDFDTAVDLYAADGSVSTIAVEAEDGVDEAVLVERLQGALADAAGTDGPGGAAVEVVTGDSLRAETRAEIDGMLGFVSTFLLVFAGISLFVGAFIIANTFQMSVRQRQRELAMLRAVGASPRQVFSSVVIQAVVIGVVGSLLGVGAGVGLVAGLRGVFETFGMELSGRIPLDGFTVVVSVLTGTLVSVVAAAVPARRAALVPPVEAMRDEVATTGRRSPVVVAAGVVLLVGGLAAVGAALAGVDGDEQLLGAGAVGVVLGVIVLAPTLVPTALGVLAAPAVVLLRPLGGLARGNVTRLPKRTASTAGALMIGMALVGAASVIAATAQESTRAIVQDETTADLLLRSATGTIPGGVPDAVAAVPGVAGSEPVSAGPLAVDGETLYVGATSAAVFGTSLDVPTLEGTTEALATGEALVQRTHAERDGLTVGDRVTFVGERGEATLRIGGIIESRALGTPFLVPPDVLGDLVPADQVMTDTVFVTVAPGTDRADVREDVTAAVREFVVVSVMDAEEFGEGIAEQVNQVLVVLYALLGLSIVIAVLGIVNTLALSIAERTREIGLLRAVGLGRLQLASVVTIESVLTAVFGTVLGLAVGVGLASTLPVVYADDGLSELAVPWAALGGMLALAVLAGVVAAVWPAVRAARMDVLDAVSHD